jgi:hypothetical protein
MKQHIIARFVCIIVVVAVSMFWGERLQATSTPFNGYELGLPATIECEQFDLGGENVAYHDTTTNNIGGKYRSEGVDIFRCEDYGGTRGYCVGNVPSGEWLLYSITNSELGDYQVKVRARTSDDNYNYGTEYNFQVLNSSNLISQSPSFVMTNTAWNDKYFILTNVPSGSHKVKLHIVASYYSSPGAYFDYFSIYKVPSKVTNNDTIRQAVLSPSSGMQTAKNNATNLQAAIDSAQTGDIVQIVPSGRFNICQPVPAENAPESSGAINVALVKTVTGMSYVNNTNTGVGIQFTVGAVPLTVTSLGRWVVGGSSDIHTLTIFDAGNNSLGSVSVTNKIGMQTGMFNYTLLGAIVTLQPGNTYSILSSERANGDLWLNNETNNVAIYEVAGGVSHKSNYPFSPVNLKYKATSKTIVHNYASIVNKSGITIKGMGTNSTTLVAYNRDTTILFCGSDGGGYPQNSPAVTNIMVQDITFEGKPTIDYTGASNSVGIVVENGGQCNIGSLLTFGGRKDGDEIKYTKNLIVTNCFFYNPSGIGIWLGYAKDVLITNCAFSYFNGISSNLASTLRGWCGVLSQSQSVQDVAILHCSFNGNGRLTNSADYATDGMVWLQTGGKWIVDDCNIANYGLEAVQFNAGPNTVVGNTFSTTNRPSSCALNLFINDNYQALMTGNSIYSVSCFVNNTVANGGAGVTGPVPGAVFGHSPYNLVTAANRFDLPGPIVTVDDGVYHPTVCVQMAYANSATVSGNKVIASGFGVAYNNYDDPAIACFPFSLQVLCNDFSKIDYSSFFLQDNPGKMRQARFTANRLGGRIYEGHLYLAMPITSNPPTIWLQGNQFWWNGYGPLVTSFSLTSPTTSTTNCLIGMRFTVGNANLMVNYLGRLVINGNTNLHTVTLYTADMNPVAGGAVTINTANQALNAFAYAELATPIFLVANTSYYLLSTETALEDSWCMNSPVVTSGATVDRLVYGANVTTSANCNGPVNFMSCVLVNPVGSNWTANAGTNLGTNVTQQYIINNPSEFSDSRFSLY